MSRKNTWLVQLVNLTGYLTLQLITNQVIAPFQQACFVYIGFFLCLPWARSNVAWQLLLGFGVGLLVDAFYDSLGIHTFAAVFLLYFRNFLLYLLLPPGANHATTISPTLRNMKIQRFSLYILIITAVYHFVVFILDTCSFHFFFFSLPKLLLSITLSYLFIFFSRIFLGATGSLYSK